MENKQVREEHLVLLREVQQQGEYIIRRLGELTFETEVLKASIPELELKRAELASLIKNEFGTDGTVNLTTGEFVPQK